MTLELEQLRLAERLARLGSYAMDLETGVFTWTPGFYRLLEIDPILPASYELFLSLVPEEDLAAFRERSTRDLASHAAYQATYRLHVGPSRREIWVRARACPMEIAGRPNLVGVLMDITERRTQRAQIEELNQQLLATVARQQDAIELLTTFPQVHA